MYDKGKFTQMLVKRSTHEVIKQLAEENGMKQWAVVEQYIPSMEELSN
ncbi:hypothetical protein [Methanolobus chelungpuianus]|nr:hypothetical protein [Methanolobus chelungpuianus]